jgi:hypothetical protein
MMNRRIGFLSQDSADSRQIESRRVKDFLDVEKKRDFGGLV